jgi:hypothetical protein
MKQRVILLIFFLILSNTIKAQNLMAKRWLLGAARVSQIVFNDTTKPIMKILYPYPPSVHYSHGGHSNICDSATGKLLFSTNGMILYDSAGNIMDNGDNLVDNKLYTHNAFPCSFTTQSSLIIPKGNNGLYYVFITSVSDSLYNWYWTGASGLPKAPFDRLEYSVVDINQNIGLGKVVTKRQKLLQGIELHKPMMQACRHSNGTDWWLLKQGEYDTNRIYRFLVKADTIEGPWVQNFSAPKYLAYDISGQFCFNHDGTKFASVQGKGVTNKLFIADFDRCTGELNNPQIVNIPIDSTTHAPLDNQGKLDSVNVGVCFSPNGQFIYISKWYNIYQYEYQQTDSVLAWYRIQHGPDTTIQEFQRYSHLYIGNDGRTYIGYQSGLAYEGSVINKPDIKGAGCEFCRKCVRLTDTIGLGNGWGYTSPPNMPDYNLGASGVVCWPVGLPNPPKEGEGQLEVYPNPANNKLKIENGELKMKELYNSVGQLLFSTKVNEIDVSRFSAGVYYLKCGTAVRKINIE